MYILELSINIEILLVINVSQYTRLPLQVTIVLLQLQTSVFLPKVVSSISAPWRLACALLSRPDTSLEPLKTFPMLPKTSLPTYPRGRKKISETHLKIQDLTDHTFPNT